MTTQAAAAGISYDNAAILQMATSSDEFIYRTCTSSSANACSQQRVAVTITAGGGGAIFKNGFE